MRSPSQTNTSASNYATANNGAASFTPESDALTSAERLSRAQEYLSSGLSLVPIGANSKAPVMDVRAYNCRNGDARRSWKIHQKHKATDDELRVWVSDYPGLGIVSGKVSGKDGAALEIFDIEAIAPLDEFRELVEEAAPGLLNRLPRTKTPTGGRHVFYRCKTVEGNQKLAQRAEEIPADELPRLEDGALDKEAIKKLGLREIGGKYFKIRTLIETRGEGGQVLSPLCLPGTHPSGGVYDLINGDLRDIPTITTKEREILLTAARACNEWTDPAKAKGTREAKAGGGKGLKPGEDYNSRSDAFVKTLELLKEHGWTVWREQSSGPLLSRPGVNDHCSARLFASGAFRVFSSNASPFGIGETYSPFAVYTELKYPSDYSAAAKALAAEGYGDRRQTRSEEPAPGAKGAQEPAQAPTTAKVGNVTFETNASGVYSIDDDGNRHWVCSPLTIEADTRNEDGEAWGRLLVVTDRDETRHEWAMPNTMLGGDGREYRERLLYLGLSIGAGRGARQMLDMYLNTKPTKSVRCVDRAGWQNEAYVLPDESLGGPDGERIYLQSESGSNHLIRTAGTLQEWKDNIAAYCLDNIFLTFAVSAAFAPPLLRPLQCESAGIHFWEDSTTGKSTLLYAAGSVWGGGGDKGYIRRWRVTSNALETVAKLHNDALLELDELKECEPNEVDKIVYMIANGQGKIRRAKSGGLRPIDEWRTFYLSSGEHTLADHLASVGKRIYSGQEVRFIDLRANADKGYGVFEKLHRLPDASLPDAKRFSEHLQRSAKRYYGTPIRAFLAELINGRRIQEAYMSFRDYKAKFEKDFLPKDAKPKVARVLDRFAQVGFAGELASEYKITGWPKDRATNAASTLFRRWFDERGVTDSSDADRAIAQVRAFLEKHGASRFQRRLNDRDTPTQSIINRAGFIDINTNGEINCYYILPEQFRTEVCAGFNPTTVLNALKERGFLKPGADRDQSEIRTSVGKTRVYAITAQIHG